MSSFELFCLIFYALDAAWDESRDPQLGEYLSSANPFLFGDIGSAEPSVYLEFCHETVEPITLENSFDLANRYIKGLDNAAVTKAFSDIDRTEWMDCAEGYLTNPHKGGN